MDVKLARNDYTFFFEAEVKKISRIWERELSNAREKGRVGRNKGSEEGGK